MGQNGIPLFFMINKKVFLAAEMYHFGTVQMYRRYKCTGLGTVQMYQRYICAISDPYEAVF